MKSLIIFCCISNDWQFSLVSLSIKDATDKAKQRNILSITNSFMIEINRRVNQGTPRGSGNVRELILKIVDSKDIVDYVKELTLLLI